MKKAWKWGLFFGGALVIVLLLRGFVFTPYVIPSSGMENALYQGDRIFVNKWSYGLRVPGMSLFSYHRWKPKPVQLGDLTVFNNPASQEKVVDKREVFISRCVGLPGDTLLLDTLFTVISNWEKAGPDRKKLYSYPAEKEATMDSLLDVLSIKYSRLMGENNHESVRSFSHYEYYLLEQALGKNNWIMPIQMQGNELVRELIVPRVGQSIKITPWNCTLYRNTILLHEGKNAEVINDSLYIDGAVAESYTFNKNYHWMASNNSINMADSRLFGFVPENHIIGKAAFIWFSKEPNSNPFTGYRWKRMMRKVK